MTSIRAVRGDITAMAVDAVVNAANVHLRHGGGVALAIARAGGPAIQEESDRWIAEHGPLAPGIAATTSAGDMPARVVVHVAGPVYQDEPDDERLLATAVEAALDAAHATGCRSIAMPAISAGVYGYPLRAATRVIATTAARWARAHSDAMAEILLVGFDEETTAAFDKALLV